MKKKAKKKRLKSKYRRGVIFVSVYLIRATDLCNKMCVDMQE